MTATTYDTAESIAFQRKARRRKYLSLAPSYIVLGLWALFTIFVMVWVVLASFKTNAEIFQDVFGLPKEWMWQNYAKAWNAANFSVFFRNSVIVTFSAVVLILAVASPAAYVLSRMQFRGRGSLTNLFVAGMGVPVMLLLIPLFVIVTGLRLVNTLPGLVMIYVTMAIPFTVYILTGFFASLPKELEEAGVIDGCTDFGVFRHIMLPLASPGLITAAIFNGIAIWNEYMLVLVFVADGNKRTLSLGLYSLQNAMQYTGDWAGLFAGVCIVMVPTIILFIVLSEKMISGITMGAVK